MERYTSQNIPDRAWFTHHNTLRGANFNESLRLYVRNIYRDVLNNQDINNQPIAWRLVLDRIIQESGRFQALFNELNLHVLSNQLVIQRVIPLHEIVNGLSVNILNAQTNPLVQNALGINFLAFIEQDYRISIRNNNILRVTLPQGHHLTREQIPSLTTRVHNLHNRMSDIIRTLRDLIDQAYTIERTHRNEYLEVETGTIFTNNTDDARPALRYLTRDLERCFELLIRDYPFIFRYL